MFSEPGLLLLSQSPGAQEGLTGWPPAGSVHPEKHYVLDFRETVMSATKEAGGGGPTSKGRKGQEKSEKAS